MVSISSDATPALVGWVKRVHETQSTILHPPSAEKSGIGIPAYKHNAVGTISESRHTRHKADGADGWR